MNLTRICALISSLLISASAFASDSSWNYTNENGETVNLLIHDVPGSTGEEYLVFNFPNIESLLIKPQSVVGGEYEANIYIGSEDGSPLIDIGISVMTGKSYQPVLELLKQKSFRDSFDFIADQCPASANAFLIRTDNLTSKMFGYCLLPAN